MVSQYIKFHINNVKLLVVLCRYVAHLVSSHGLGQWALSHSSKIKLINDTWLIPDRVRAN